jgi:hypothetical protein
MEIHRKLLCWDKTVGIPAQCNNACLRSCDFNQRVPVVYH